MVSWTWFLGALLISWVFVPVVERRIPDLEGWAFAVAACFAVLLGLSVLVHELAHAVVAMRLGQQVRGITLHLLGGVSEIVGAQSRPWADFVIAAVGPIASLRGGSSRIRCPAVERYAGPSYTWCCGS